MLRPALVLVLVLAAPLARAAVITLTKYTGTSCTPSPTNFIAGLTGAPGSGEYVVPQTCTYLATGLYVKAHSSMCRWMYYSDSNCASLIWDSNGGFGTLKLGDFPIAKDTCFQGNTAADYPHIMHCETERYRTCPAEVFDAFQAGTCITGVCAPNIVSQICASPSCSLYLNQIAISQIQSPAHFCQGTGAASSNPCFPSSATVTLADGTPSRIDELKEGDAIVAATDDGAITTDTVSLLSIDQPEATAPFVVLTTTANKTLHLTEGHHLPVGATCCSNLKEAKDVSVGETVWAVQAGKATPTKITAKGVAKDSRLVGLHSPVLTSGGFPVVDGVITSFDTIEKVTLAKHGLAALIAACKATGTCDKFKETFLEDAGSHQYIDAVEA